MANIKVNICSCVHITLTTIKHEINDLNKLSRKFIVYISAALNLQHQPKTCFYLETEKEEKGLCQSSGREEKMPLCFWPWHFNAVSLGLRPCDSVCLGGRNQEAFADSEQSVQEISGAADEDAERLPAVLCSLHQTQRIQEAHGEYLHSGYEQNNLLFGDLIEQLCSRL